MIKNYFLDDHYNDDINEWYENRPRMGTLKDVAEYDKTYVTNILAADNIPEGDRAVIASCILDWMDKAIGSNNVSKSFEEFLIEVHGRDWFDKMVAAWLGRESAELAREWGCPELMPKNLGLFNLDDLK